MLIYSKNNGNSFHSKLANLFLIVVFSQLLGLSATPIMKAYAGSLDRLSYDFSGRDNKVDPPSQADPPNHPGPLASYFDAGCALYGIDDYLLNDSYFFCLNSSDFQFNFVIQGGDYEGLDYDTKFNVLLASAGDDAFPAIYNGDILGIVPYADSCDAQPFISFGPIIVGNQAMEEVDGIAFDNEGNLFGWAQEAGLFKLSVGATVNDGEMLLNQPGEVEDIEVVGDCLVGLLNIDHLGQAEDGDGEQHPNHPISPEDINTAVDTSGILKANYVRYCPTTGILDTPCEQQVINALQAYQATEIEAIEVLPPLPDEEGTKILLGFHTNSHVGRGNGNPPPGSNSYNTLVLGILDISNCSLQTQALYEIPRDITIRDNLDIEGLAMVCPLP
jgi:hypothetical protein